MSVNPLNQSDLSDHILTDPRAPDDTRSPFERVYRGVIRALYEGLYVPGQRLIAPDLMREFDAGRGTIREVLQRLASTGVVRMTPQKGARVRRLSRREVIEVLDVVEMLLGLAARGAAKALGDPSARANLQKRYEALMAIHSEVDFSSFVSVREEYYRTIMQLADNRELTRIFPSIQVHIMRMQLRMFNRAGDSVDPVDYQQLHSALLSGDADKAEQAGRTHVQRTMGRIADLPDRAFDSEAS